MFARRQDRFVFVFIDPFAMAYSFLYEVLPVLVELKTTVEKEGVGG